MPTLPDPKQELAAIGLRTVPLLLAGIAGDPDLSLTAKGALLVTLCAPQLEDPAGVPVTRGGLLRRGRDPRWLVDAALAELVETRWLAPAGDGRYTLRDDPDDPGLGPDRDGAR
jgi:hypothetical protein